jgi:hypothetical protein
VIMCWQAWSHSWGQSQKRRRWRRAVREGQQGWCACPRIAIWPSSHGRAKDQGLGTKRGVLGHVSRMGVCGLFGLQFSSLQTCAQCGQLQSSLRSRTSPSLLDAHEPRRTGETQAAGHQSRRGRQRSTPARRWRGRGRAAGPVSCPRRWSPSRYPHLIRPWQEHDGREAATGEEGGNQKRCIKKSLRQAG